MNNRLTKGLRDKGEEGERTDTKRLFRLISPGCSRKFVPITFWKLFRNSKFDMNLLGDPNFVKDIPEAYMIAIRKCVMDIPKTRCGHSQKIPNCVERTREAHYCYLRKHTPGLPWNKPWGAPKHFAPCKTLQGPIETCCGDLRIPEDILWEPLKNVAEVAREHTVETP